MPRSSIKNLARAQPIRASRPNRGRIHAHTRPDQAVQHEQPSRAPARKHASRTADRASVRKHALGRAYVRNVHSTVHTSKFTHSLAQVSLNILCSTHSNVDYEFCLWLSTCGVTAGLTMWDISSNFILTFYPCLSFLCIVKCIMKLLKTHIFPYQPIKIILNSYFTNFHNVCEKSHDSAVVESATSGWGGVGDVGVSAECSVVEASC